MKSKQLFTSDKRIVVLTVFLLVAFGILALRLAVLQIVSAGYYKALAEDQYNVFRRLIPNRGEIKITDAVSPETFIVATNVTKNTLFAVPKEIQDKQGVAAAVGPILGIEAEELLGKINDETRKYVVIKRQLTEEEEQKIKELKLTGLGFDPEIVRYYPEKRFLSHVLGFVGYKDDEKVGLYGLEKYFQGELAGTQGSLTQERDAGGSWIFGGKRELVPAKDGDNFILTIDRSVQFKAQTVLEQTIQKHSADGGCIAVMQPKTGAILAMASFPDFDPNEYNKVDDHKVFNNSCTTGSYEPGSVFKPFTMAGSLDAGKITPETTYTDTGSVVIDNHTIKNSDNQAHGLQTMTQALEQSLNTGVIFAKDQIGDAAFSEYVKKFGFGKATGIELPEAVGDTRSLDSKIAVNFATASFGQGISVTPIQLLQGYSAFINSGRMVRPYIVQARISPSGDSHPTKPILTDPIISTKAASTVGAMLVNVVENGHGQKAKVHGYYIAGKTGTAQVARKDRRGYEDNNNIGSFVGFGPVEDPKFLAIVRIDHPRTVQFAESTAAPAFGELAQFILSYYNVPPTRK